MLADLQAVAVFEVVAIAVSCFNFPPCYPCCSSSLNLVQWSLWNADLELFCRTLAESFTELLEVVWQHLDLCLSSWGLRERWTKGSSTSYSATTMRSCKWMLLLQWCKSMMILWPYSLAVALRFDQCCCCYAAHAHCVLTVMANAMLSHWVFKRITCLYRVTIFVFRLTGSSFESLWERALRLLSLAS